HPVLAGATEAVELGQLIESTFAGGTPADTSALRRYLELLAANRDDLQRTLDDAPMLAEIDPWSRKLTLLARAALRGLDALNGTGSATDYQSEKADALASGHELVAADQFPGGLEALVGGEVHSVDRFGDLFAAIDRRL